MESTGSSVTEGIGIMRITENFKRASIDDAIRVTDQEMIDMVYHLAENDGLVLGTSSGINAMAAYRLAQDNMGSGKNHRHHPLRSRHALLIETPESRMARREIARSEKADVHGELTSGRKK